MGPKKIPRALSKLAKPKRNTFGVVYKDRRQKEVFECLQQRKIVGTRFMDLQVIKELGIEDDMNYMLDKLHWHDFMKTDLGTFKKITLEFLSSFEVNFTTTDPNWIIKFRLFNKDYEWDLEKFNHVYGTRCEGCVEVLYDNGFHENEVWKSITTELSYVPQFSKSLSIQNPTLRYFHTMISNTIFGRGGDDNFNVTCKDLFLLWCGLEGYQFNTGAFLAIHMLSVVSERGDIAIGGLITRIAMVCSEEDLHYADFMLVANNKIDLQACFDMGWITKEGEKYMWKLKDGEIMTLPNPIRTSIRCSANWKMIMDHGEEENQVNNNIGGAMLGEHVSVGRIIDEGKKFCNGEKTLAKVRNLLKTRELVIEEIKQKQKNLETNFSGSLQKLKAIHEWHKSRGDFEDRFA